MSVNFRLNQIIKNSIKNFADDKSISEADSPYSANPLGHSPNFPSADTLNAYYGVRYKIDTEKTVNNPIIKELLNTDYEEFNLPKSVLFDVDQKLSLVDDQKVLNFANKKLNEYLKSAKENPDEFYEDGSEVDSILDAVNAANNKYAYIGEIDGAAGEISGKSKASEYIDYLKKVYPDEYDYLQSFIKNKFNESSEPPEYEEYFEIKKSTPEAFLNEQRFEKLKKFLNYKSCADDSLKNYLYKEYYLNKINLPSEIKELCEKISKEYGTKVFINNTEEDFAALKNTLEELSEWQKTAKNKIFLPQVLDLSPINREYIDYEQGEPTAAISSPITKSLWVNSGENLGYTLRHEITHFNDPYYRYNTEIYRKKHTFVYDFESTAPKFKTELLKAGIAPEDIKNALKDRAEFIAIAAEGVTKNYSEEFKKVLLDWGLPENVFEMKVFNPQILENALKYQ